MSNLLDLDLSKKYTYNLYLCRTSDMYVLSQLKEAENIVYTGTFQDTDELTFDIPRSDMDEYTHQPVLNPNFDLIDGDMLIKCEIKEADFVKYFIIQLPDKKDDGSKEILSVQCYSREIILGDKNVISATKGTYSLYFPRLYYSFDNNTWTEYNVNANDNGGIIPIDCTNHTHLYLKTRDITNTTDILADTDCTAAKNVTINGLNIVIASVNSKLQAIILNDMFNSQNGYGILNCLEDDTDNSWSIGYIDSDVIGDNSSGNISIKYRYFDVGTDKTWLDMIRTDIEQAFNCVFDFDTENKVVNCYYLDNLSINKGIYLSDDNLLKTIDIQSQYSELFTRLKVYGKNNLSIQDVSLTGEEFIEDISHYLNTKYMPQDLINTYNNWTTLLNSKKGIYSGYLTQLATLEDTLTTKQQELSTLNNDKDIINTNINDAIVGQQSTTDLYNQLNAKNSQISAKQTEINSVQSQIDTVNNNISTLQNQISRKNNFTTEQLKQLDNLIKWKTWTNESYDNSTELYNAAKIAFDTIKEPVIQYAIEISSLFDIAEYQNEWSRFTLGSLITIKKTRFGVNNLVQRLVGFVHSVDECTLTVTLSNKARIEDATRYISSESNNVASTSSTVSANKINWDMSTQNNDWINTFISNAFNAASHEIVADDENIQIGKHGIILQKASDSGQLRLLSNIIAMTEDGTNWTLAITPKGIVAERLIGQVILSQETYVADPNGQFSIKGNLQVIKDGNGVTKLMIGEYVNGTWGIQIMNSSGATSITGDSIDCSKLTVSHLSASSIDTGTLDANLVNVINLKASSIDTNDLYIKGENITDLINNCRIGIGDTYIDGSGAYRTVGGSNYQFKSLVAVGTGTIHGSDGTIPVQLPSSFINKSFSVIVSIRTANNTSGGATGFSIWSNPNTWNSSNATFGVTGWSTESADYPLDFSWVAVA